MKSFSRRIITGLVVALSLSAYTSTSSAYLESWDEWFGDDFGGGMGGCGEFWIYDAGLSGPCSFTWDYGPLTYVRGDGGGYAQAPRPVNILPAPVAQISVSQDELFQLLQDPSGILRYSGSNYFVDAQTIGAGAIVFGEVVTAPVAVVVTVGVGAAIVIYVYRNDIANALNNAVATLRNNTQSNAGQKVSYNWATSQLKRMGCGTPNPEQKRKIEQAGRSYPYGRDKCDLLTDMMDIMNCDAYDKLPAECNPEPKCQPGRPCGL